MPLINDKAVTVFPQIYYLISEFVPLAEGVKTDD